MSFEPGDRVVCVDASMSYDFSKSWHPTVGKVYTVTKYWPADAYEDGASCGGVDLYEDPAPVASGLDCYGEGWRETRFRKVELKSDLITRLMANEYDVPAGERDVKRPVKVMT